LGGLNGLSSTCIPPFCVNAKQQESNKAKVNDEKTITAQQILQQTLTESKRR
jgi:hypothetical protein